MWEKQRKAEAKRAKKEMKYGYSDPAVNPSLFYGYHPIAPDGARMFHQTGGYGAGPVQYPTASVMQPPSAFPPSAAH